MASHTGQVLGGGSPLVRSEGAMPVEQLGAERATHEQRMGPPLLEALPSHSGPAEERVSYFSFFSFCDLQQVNIRSAKFQWLF